MILGSDGSSATAITNSHVVRGLRSRRTGNSSGKLEITLPDGTAIPTEVLGDDPPSDLAVVRFTPEQERFRAELRAFLKEQLPPDWRVENDREGMGAEGIEMIPIPAARGSRRRATVRRSSIVKHRANRRSFACSSGRRNLSSSARCFLRAAPICSRVRGTPPITSGRTGSTIW